MKNTTKRKISDKHAGKPLHVCVLRLCNQETYHGVFLRLGWLTYDLNSGVVFSFEPLINAFTCPVEASNIADQISAAMGMPVINVGLHSTTKH